MNKTKQNKKQQQNSIKKAKIPKINPELGL
jgi:hypothetical protein